MPPKFYWLEFARSVKDSEIAKKTEAWWRSIGAIGNARMAAGDWTCLRSERFNLSAA